MVKNIFSRKVDCLKISEKYFAYMYPKKIVFIEKIYEKKIFEKYCDKKYLKKCSVQYKK